MNNAVVIDWLWIPVTLWAAFAQTVRNAAQRHLTAELGTLGATLVRFLYGLPFAALWLLAVSFFTSVAVPAANGTFLGWVALGAVSQIGGTAFLLRTMQERNFALGVAYSKTEILQVAVFGLAFLGDPLGPASIAAVTCGTLGVLLLSPAGWGGGWMSRSALLGLASGAGFALSAVGYRGAALALEGTPYASLKNLFKGPTGIAYANDPVAAAKVAVEFAKKNEKFLVIGGAMGETVLNADGVKALATLPSLDELRGKIIGLLNAPATKVAGVVQAPAGQLARLLNAYATKV